MPPPRRTGLILPSSNVVVEETIQGRDRPPADGAVFHVARLSVVQVDMGASSREQFADGRMERAVADLTEAGVERIVFAGTAGGWLGLSAERAWVERTRESTGIEVSTTTLLCVERMRRFDAPEIALVTPFLDEVHARIEDTFRDEGFRVARGASLGLPSSREMAEAEPACIAELIRRCAPERRRGVLCFCTNFRGGDAVRLLGSEVDRACVTDSVEVTLALPQRR